MARLVLKNGRQKDTCYDEIGLSNTQNVDTILETWLSTQLGTHVLNENKIFTVTSDPKTFASQLRSWNLNWQSSWFTTANHMRQVSQFNPTLWKKMYVELEAATIGPHSLIFSRCMLTSVDMWFVFLASAFLGCSPHQFNWRTPMATLAM